MPPDGPKLECWSEVKKVAQQIGRLPHVVLRGQLADEVIGGTTTTGMQCAGRLVDVWLGGVMEEGVHCGFSFSG